MRNNQNTHLGSRSAGSTDSALTSHGHIQTQRLGAHLAKSNIRLTHIFSSDLSRARKTAEAILDAQRAKYPSTECHAAKQSQESRKLKIIEVASLREQDFGSLERCSFTSSATAHGSSDEQRASKRPRQRNTHSLKASTSTCSDTRPLDWCEIESKSSLTARANSFIDTLLIPILFDPHCMHNQDKSEPVVAVVSHGMTLSALWKALLRRFALHAVALANGVHVRGDDFAHLGGWSNTGYLDLQITYQSGQTSAAQATKAVLSSLTHSDTDKMLYDWNVLVRGVNCRSHLSDLKRTRGGLGSARHDEKQMPLDAFLKGAAKDGPARRKRSREGE